MLVEILEEAASDAGSTPAASTNAMPVTNDQQDENEQTLPMTSDWEAVWADIDRRYTRTKDSQGALAELFRRYRKLDLDGRRTANEVLFASLLRDDEGKRYDALAIINEFRLIEAAGVLRQLAARLRLDPSPGAPFELAKVEKFLRKLQSL